MPIVAEAAPPRVWVRGWPLVAIVLAAGALYALGDELSWSWFGAESIGLAFFPAAGVALVALLVLRVRQWPAVVAIVVVAEVVVDRGHGLAWDLTIAYAAANVVEALVSAVCLRRAVRARPRLLTLTERVDLLVFLALGCIAGPAAGGLIGATAKSLDASSPWGMNLVRWIAGDGLGVLVVAAPLLVLLTDRRAPDRRLLAFVAGAGLVVGLTFFGWDVGSTIVVLPVLVIGALVFDVRGVATTSFVVCVLANRATAAGVGLAGHVALSEAARLALVQAYLGTVVLSAWVVAIEVRGRADAGRARAAEERRRRRAEFTARIALLREELAATTGGREVAALVFRAASELVGCDAVVVGSGGRPGSEAVDGRLHPAVNAAIAEWAVTGDGPGVAAGRGTVVVADLATVAGAPSSSAPVAIASLPMSTCVAVPLPATFGAGGFLLGVWCEPPESTDEALDLLGLAADGIAHASAQARALEEEVAAIERTARLQHVTASLGRARTAAEVTQIVEGAASDFEVAALRLELRDEGPWPTRIPALDPARVGAVLPVRCGFGTVGSLRALLGDGQDLREQDRRSLAMLADLCGQTLERTRLAEYEHDVALRLQRSLHGSMDRVDGLDAAAVYVAGEQGLEVGGDWYDVIRLGSDAVLVVVGDVVGKGVDAAAAMGQLRSAIRVIAIETRDPAELLTRLERFAATMPSARGATLFVGEIDLTTGCLRYATAAHPPPVLRRRTGGVELLVRGQGTPIVGLHRPRHAAEVALEPGDALVMYTDGLVERRGEPLERGLWRVANAVERRVPGSDRQHWCEETISHLLDGSPRPDDVALLRVDVDRLRTRFVSAGDVTDLAEMRRGTRAWLHARHVERDVVDAVVLTTGEALANAVEHSGAGPGGVVLDVSCTADAVVAAVTDDGRWLDRPPQPDRGRGIALMRAFADAVEVGPDPTGRGTVVRLTHRLDH
ncbi:MAG: SpoIIE family protein phosphatase [Acidimicrobiia bacterium]